MIKRTAFKHLLLLLALMLHYGIALRAQPARVLQLEQRVYALNNAARYDSTQLLLEHFLSNIATTPEDKYYANLYLSYLHKRLFDYPGTLRYLDEALRWGKQTDSADYFIDNIKCEKAFAYFDITHYDSAALLMADIAASNYQHINAENRAKIMMQQAYLLFLDKKYTDAEVLYDQSLMLMQGSGICNQPLVYGKKIELYAKMHDTAKMLNSYRLAMHIADSCKITKYAMYATEMLRNGYGTLCDYKNAYYTNKYYDSILDIYNKEAHFEKITELETRYGAAQKEKELIGKEKELAKRNFLIALLMLAIIAIALLMLVYLLQQKRRKEMRESTIAAQYTRQLLEKTELERKRLAADLHDSVNHELLTIKNTIPEENSKIKRMIDEVIDQVRGISRNLHPALFETLGLERSIAQLCERVQAHNDFMLTCDIHYNNSLNPNQEIQIYRIVQEAVTNMVKYANAIAGIIIINEDAQSVNIMIKDNGKGFDVQSTLSGNKAFGLHNILERSKAIFGEAKINASPQGTTITITIPKNTL